SPMLSWITGSGGISQPDRSEYLHVLRGRMYHLAVLCRRNVSSTRVYISGATPGPDRRSLSSWGLQRLPTSLDTHSSVAPERTSSPISPAHRDARRRIAVERLRFWA